MLEEAKLWLDSGIIFGPETAQFERFNVACPRVTLEQALTQLKDALDKHLANLEAVADIPVLTGFGVSTKADIERFNKVSDGVIVGTKIVRDLHGGKADDVAAFVTYGSNYQK